MASRPFNPMPGGSSQRHRRHRRNAQWRRDRRPRLSMASLTAALEIIPTLPRPLLVRLTARMIDRLDQLDGDCDLEDDDPAGGNPDDTGEEEEWCPDGVKLALPIFGIDQTTGPINERETYEAWQRHVQAR